MERIEQLQLFIAENAADTFSRYALGLEYMKQENFEAAESCFRFLSENYPEYIGTYYQFGKLLQQSGKDEEAKSTFRKGMELTKNSDLKTYSELQNALTNLELGLDE
ncbi:MAG: tetratricopeptide repeat protein [Bacteroidota bacterium]